MPIARLVAPTARVARHTRRPSRQLAVGLRGEGRGALVARGDDPDPRGVERVEDRQEALAGDGEGDPDAGRTQRRSDQLGDGRGLRGGGRAVVLGIADVIDRGAQGVAAGGIGHGDVGRWRWLQLDSRRHVGPLGTATASGSGTRTASAGLNSADSSGSAMARGSGSAGDTATARGDSAGRTARCATSTSGSGCGFGSGATCGIPSDAAAPTVSASSTGVDSVSSPVRLLGGRVVLGVHWRPPASGLDGGPSVAGACGLVVRDGLVPSWA